jgi:hypothetical protein
MGQKSIFRPVARISHGAARVGDQGSEGNACARLRKSLHLFKLPKSQAIENYN